MAQTLSVTATLSNSGTGESIDETITVTTTGDHEDGGVQTVGTSEETIVWSGTDLATPGYIWLKNLDITNYIQVGNSTGDYTIRLKAGQIAIFPLDDAVTTLYVKANTADCKLRYKVYEQ